MSLKLNRDCPLVVFCLMLLLFVSTISANEDEDIQQAIAAYQERPWEFGLAAGYGRRRNPLVNSDDIPLYVVFDVAWFGDWFFFDNGDLGVALHETNTLSVNLIAHVNNERGVFEFFNNSQLGVQFFPDNGFSPATPQPDPLTQNPELANQPAKPPKRRFAVDGGLEVIYADVWGDLQLQVLSDISMRHKGMEVWASYAYTLDFDNWKLTPSIGINWKSSNYLDYYYGVKQSEALVNRPAYSANSGFNGFARLSMSYRFNDHWGIVGVAEYESLSRSIRRSPIVNRNNINTFFIGLMYRF